eukprot:scaffold132786_cov63-Phaeocystis_antarctica.AAC.2
MALKRRDASPWLSPRRAAERALLSLRQLTCPWSSVAEGAIDVLVPRAAVLHMDVAVVFIVGRCDAVILEQGGDLVPDVAAFPLLEDEELGRPRAPRAEAGMPLVRNDAEFQRPVVSICVQHVHALRHHSQCGDARLERVLRLLDVRSVWLVEHGFRDVGGDEEDVLEEVLVALQLGYNELRLRHRRAREVALALIHVPFLALARVIGVGPLPRDGDLVLVLHVHEKHRQLAHRLRVAIEHKLAVSIRFWLHSGHQELGQRDRCGAWVGAQESDARVATVCGRRERTEVKGGGGERQQQHSGTPCCKPKHLKQGRRCPLQRASVPATGGTNTRTQSGTSSATATAASPSAIRTHEL